MVGKHAYVRAENSLFLRNEALYGGAIYTHEYGIFDSYESTFDGNYAIEGGAIYVENEGNLIVEKSTFARNMALNGVAIKVYITHEDL